MKHENCVLRTNKDYRKLLIPMELDLRGPSCTLLQIEFKLT